MTKGFMRRFAGGRNVMLATGDGVAVPAAGVEWVFRPPLRTRELDRISRISRSWLVESATIVYAGRFRRKALPGLD